MINFPCESPTADCLAISLKQGFDKTLSQEICQHHVGGALDDGELSSVVVIPEPVPLDQEVLGP